MSSRVYYYAPLILMVFMLVYPMGALGVSIAKTLRKKKKIGMKLKIKAYTPIFNLAFIHKELYGSSQIILILCVLILGLLLCRPVGLLLYFIDPSLSIFGTTLFLIGLVGWYLLMGYTCFDLCIMLHRGLFNKILSFILAPIVAYLLIEAVPVYFRQEKEVLDGTFNPQQD